MNLSIAIEILIIHSKEQRFEIATDIGEAIKLGIEALKRIDNQRSTHAWKPETLLPGETKENL